ncbi:dTDP-4-dehydrorhamnose 3,5-epimerase [Clostridium paraputrificum]|uniref:dTDP-4-dehydrorhamnose 3,5-epimerase n=1 Tax=Clostridium TaxID=1485 RepID=UPI003D35787E
MFFIETRLKGSYIVSMEKIGDSRGSFSRAWCKREMESYGLDADILQCNMSYNAKAGTLRGMHFQKEPFSETKYIRCIKGSFYDVIIDLREDSPTFAQWIGVELSEKNGKALYVPKGFAHGYLTLEDNTIAYYQVTEFYNKESESGVRWNDKKFNIEWPLINELIISEKDRKWPLFQE